MPTTTWTFDSSLQSWSFEDDSRCAGCSASRTHIAGAIKNTLILANVADTSSVGRNFSGDSLNVVSTVGDSISADLSATSDGDDSQVNIAVHFTDSTIEISGATVWSASPITKTYVVVDNSKTVDFIEIRLARSTGAGAMGSTHSINLLEVRYTTTNIIVPAPGKLVTPGSLAVPAGDMASISADNDFLYIAAFNNLGFPTLVKIASSLLLDGSVVFDPLDGTRIGVQCGTFNDDHVWIFGQFDSTNTVEKSENAGSSFAVKDDGSFGAISAFVVGPDKDERVLIFDRDNGDLIESTDDGATWITINAAVTPLANSLSRGALNLQEIVLGNDGGANNSIDYSVNTGVDLEDYQTGVYPNENATKVIMMARKL